MMKENQKIARTDLAIELAQPLLEAEKLPEGLKVHTQTHGAVEITCVQIASPKASQQLQKPCGRYITIQTPPLWNSLLDPQQEIDAAADCIRSLLPQEGTVLVVGLGNSSITPDALGPQVAQHILVTRHLTEEFARSLGMGSLRKTAALIPGVLGQTGVESGELTAALVNFIQPSAVIVVDALAAQDYGRLGRTIQISDSGIAPGSGVQNSRKELLDKLGEIKRHNKQRLADYIKAHNGIEVNMDSIFDVQVKRLHEYKRQMLNILHIISLYHKLKDNPDMDFVPRTFIFGSKTAPGYAVAKKTIQLINSISKMIDNDPAVRDKLKVVFLEDYKVSLAEIIMPAAEVSEQISIAGKEASGTGNMKFMMNGALTIGTMDGANVEICEAVGKENIFIFGMETPEAEALAASGSYEPMVIYQNDPVIRRVLDQMIHGFGDGVDYTDIANLLLHGGNGGPADRYMSLKDFASYAAAQERVSEVYRDQDQWNRMALINIANSGRFAADRSIAEYAQNIWRVKTNFAF